MLSTKIKRFANEEHTIEEHIAFLYEVVYSIADMLEELETEIEEIKSIDTTGGKLRIKIK